MVDPLLALPCTKEQKNRSNVDLFLGFLSSNAVPSIFAPFSISLLFAHSSKQMVAASAAITES